MAELWGVVFQILIRCVHFYLFTTNNFAILCDYFLISFNIFPCFGVTVSEQSILWIRRSAVEVFTEDPRPEDPGPDPGLVQVRVYILNSQPGPGRVPIYYFGSRVFLTLCVIPESIGEHRTRE